MIRIDKMKHFHYNGYSGSAKISVEDSCLFGKIEYISDLVTDVTHKNIFVHERHEKHEKVTELWHSC